MNLLEKINSKTAVIGIIGLGYVGMPLGLEFAAKGFSVLGFDVDKNKIPLLKAGKSYIKHINSDKIKTAVESGKFEATSDFSRLPETDAIVICVPTPLNEHREPDISYIKSTAETVAKYLRKGQLISLESTTYPGTTEEVLLPLFESAQLSKTKKREYEKYVPTLEGDVFTEAQLEAEGEEIDLYVDEDELELKKYKVGEDFFLAFSPEREDPNNASFNTATIPKVVGGVTPQCLEAAQALYDTVVIQTVPVSSTRAAEATKLLENIYRAVNIALVNETKMVLDKMDIDVWEVIDAASTKPFGFHPFYPGPGLGGHCIPIDPFYLTWKAREFEIHTKFIELAGEINTHMPYYVIEKSAEALNRHKKSLNGAKILLLGIAYKKDIDDMRESPSLRLIELLKKFGSNVSFSDPHVQKLPRTRKYNFNMETTPITEESLGYFDLVILSTDHSDYDYELIFNNSTLIVDTRNAFGKRGFADSKIIKA